MTVAVAAWLGQDKKRKKNDEPVTQVLELPNEPPAAVVAGADRLTFQVSPTLRKGSALAAAPGRSQMGSSPGSPGRSPAGVCRRERRHRRVQMIVSEVFSDKRLAMPALSVVQIGALPMEGAQVLLEAVMSEKKLPTRTVSLSCPGSPSLSRSRSNRLYRWRRSLSGGCGSRSSRPASKPAMCSVWAAT